MKFWLGNPALHGNLCMEMFLTNMDEIVYLVLVNSPNQNLRQICQGFMSYKEPKNKKLIPFYIDYRAHNIFEVFRPAHI